MNKMRRKNENIVELGAIAIVAFLRIRNEQYYPNKLLHDNNSNVLQRIRNAECHVHVQLYIVHCYNEENEIKIIYERNKSSTHIAHEHEYSAVLLYGFCVSRYSVCQTNSFVIGSLGNKNK